MNAHQPLPSPKQKQNRKKRRLYDHQSKAEKVLATEVTVKLVINTILTVAAIASLGKLLPYHLSQQAKLQEVEDEIQDTQKRVNQLNEEFSYYFDTKQSQSLIKKYSLKVNPNERRVFWIIQEQIQKGKPAN